MDQKWSSPTKQRSRSGYVSLSIHFPAILTRTRTKGRNTTTTLYLLLPKPEQVQSKSWSMISKAIKRSITTRLITDSILVLEDQQAWSKSCQYYTQAWHLTRRGANNLLSPGLLKLQFDQLLSNLHHSEKKESVRKILQITPLWFV